MIDVAVLTREHLLTQSAVTGLLGTNKNGSIYASPDLPEHFDPTLGPGIQIIRSGGVSNPEIPPLIKGRVQLRVWADKEKYQLASDVYGAARDSLQGIANLSLDEGALLSAVEVTGPQEMTDPETGWTSVSGFYVITATPN